MLKRRDLVRPKVRHRHGIGHLVQRGDGGGRPDGGRDLDLTEHAVRGCLGARGARRDVLSGDDDRDLWVSVMLDDVDEVDAETLPSFSPHPLASEATSTHVIVHFAHRPRVPVSKGPRHMTRDEAVAFLAPLELQAHDETHFDVPLPMGRMRAGVY